MKAIFLLDNNEYVEVEATALQLRQLGPGQAALGLTLTVPLKNEDGTPQLDDKGQPVTSLAFRPFINYLVDLTVTPPPAEAGATDLGAAKVSDVAPVISSKKAKKKGK
jgi:hypothetical protein